MRLKKIDVLSFAKLNAFIMAIMGLLIGLFLAGIGGIASTMTGSMGAFAGMGLIGIIIIPIIYGVFGFIIGALSAWLYNLFAQWFGGVELEFEK